MAISEGPLFVLLILANELIAPASVGASPIVAVERRLSRQIVGGLEPRIHCVTSGVPNTKTCASH